MIKFLLVEGDIVNEGVGVVIRLDSNSNLDSDSESRSTLGSLCVSRAYQIRSMVSMTSILGKKKCVGD